MTDTNLLSRNPNQTWQTPWTVFNPINAICHFDVDLAASADNAKCPLFITEEMDSLSLNWFNYVRAIKPYRKFPIGFLNPPYDFLFPWVEKSYLESNNGFTTFCLLPPNIDNRWFIQLVQPGGGIVDDKRVECWNYIGGLKDPSYGHKPKSNNISRIAFVDPVGSRVSPSKGNIGVFHYAAGAPRYILPPDQWRRMF